MEIISRKEAELCLWYFRKHIHPAAELIGAFGKGADSSNHDIDVYINYEGTPTERDKRIFKKLLDAKKVENTDWGGWYFHGTPFGDVDVFFDISKFDY